MTKNELIVGEPRLGWFIDGNEDTDSISVMLRDTGTTIQLSVPLQGMFGPNDPYDRWWSQGAVFDDDPDRSKHTYNPPNVLLMWLFRIQGVVGFGAGVALARRQMLLGIIALAVGIGFFLLTRREQARLESTRAQRSEPGPD